MVASNDNNNEPNSYNDIEYDSSESLTADSEPEEGDDMDDDSQIEREDREDREEEANQDPEALTSKSKEFKDFIVADEDLDEEEAFGDGDEGNHRDEDFSYSRFNNELDKSEDKMAQRFVANRYKKNSNYNVNTNTSMSNDNETQIYNNKGDEYDDDDGDDDEKGARNKSTRKKNRNDMNVKKSCKEIDARLGGKKCEEDIEAEIRILGGTDDIYDPNNTLLLNLTKELFNMNDYDERTGEPTKKLLKEMFNLLLRYQLKWTCPEGMDYYEFAKKRFKINIEAYSSDISPGQALMDAFHQFNCEIALVITLFWNKAKKWKNNHPNLKIVNRETQKIYWQINSLYKILFEAQEYHRSLHKCKPPPFSINAFMRINDPTKHFNGVTSLVHDALNQLQQRGYKHKGAFIQEEFKYKGQPTGFWQDVCTIYHFIKTSYNFVSAKLSFLKDSISSWSGAVSYLEDCDEPRFPPIQVSRRLFSFINGRYAAHVRIGSKVYLDKFFPYGSEPPELASIGSVNFFPIVFTATQDVGPHYTKCNQTGDYVFRYKDNEDRPFRIKQSDIDEKKYEQPLPSYFKTLETPSVSSIFDFQKFSDQKKLHFWVQFGRSLFKLGEIDLWEKLPYLIGVAGSGKSTMISWVASLFPKSEVGIIANNIEKQFGLYPHYGKLLCIGPEIKRDFQLGEAELQSMISAEGMSIAIKSNKSKDVIWITMMWMAGNEYFRTTNTGGAAKRRILPFRFAYRIPSKTLKTNMKHLLQLDMAAGIRKGFWAYMEELAVVKDKGLDDDLPPEIKKEIKEFEELTNSIYSYLQSNELTVPQANEEHPDFKKTYIPRTVFLSNFAVYCDLNGIYKMDVSSSNTQHIFPEFRIKEKKIEEPVFYNGQKYEKGTTFFYGVDLFGRTNESNRVISHLKNPFDAVEATKRYKNNNKTQQSQPPQQQQQQGQNGGQNGKRKQAGDSTDNNSFAATAPETSTKRRCFAKRLD
jgi:hypothetical protein